MAFTEDLTQFFSDFAATATKSGVAVAGIFDKAYGEAFGMIAGNDPVFRTASSTGIVRGDTLVIGGVSYTVVNVEPDGTGLDLCRLEAA